MPPSFKSRVRRCILTASVLAVLSGVLLGFTPWASALPQGANNSKGAVVVFFFYADNYPPCQDVAKVVQQSQHRYGDQLRIVRVNMEDPRNQPFIKEVGVLGVPALVLASKTGERLKNLVGARRCSELPILLDALIPASATVAPAAVGELPPPAAEPILVRQQPKLDPPG